MVINLVVACPGSEVCADWGLHHAVLACARLELAEEEGRLEEKKIVGSGDNHKASTMGCSPVVFDYLVGQTSDYSSVIVAIEDLKDLHAKLAENDHAGLTCWCIRISNRLHWK